MYYNSPSPAPATVNVGDLSYVADGEGIATPDTEEHEVDVDAAVVRQVRVHRQIRDEQQAV